ncbi:MAG: InlB B-repeat-containing protein [Clostridiales bacterium]|nr:InlB B-repeat-containing protein [Clostridiales bacterium]
MVKKANVKILSLLLALLMTTAMFTGILAAAAELESDFLSVEQADESAAKLVVGFVYFGTDASSSGTHSFVEIYNPNDFTVALTEFYSLQYKSMDLVKTPDWLKLDLIGEIPAKHSFLVNMGETGSMPAGQVGRLDLRDKTFDQDFVEAFDKAHNKGVKVVLMANLDRLPSDLRNPFDGDGAGQVDGYVDMYGVSGNDNDPLQQTDGYETECIACGASEAQSKQKGFVRINKESGIKYEDTDNNLQDFQQVDFRSSDINDPLRIPRSLEDGSFVLDGGGEPTPTFAAEALTLTPGADAAAMNFNWYSDRDDDAASAVQVAKKSAMTGGEFPAAGAFIVNGTSGDATEGKSWHKAGVSGLEPDTAYVYRVSNDGLNFSAVYEFKTGSAGAFSFAVVGDPQLTTGNQDSTSSYRPDGEVGTTKQGWQDTVSAIANKGVDFIAGVGDQVDVSLTTNEAEYANFFAPAELRGLPFAPAVGNHDRHDGFAYHYNLPNEQSFATLTGPAYGNPTAPQAEAEARGNYYYAYNNALFVVLNTSSYPTGAEAAAEVVARFDATLQEATEAHAGQYDWLFVQHHKSTASVADHIADRDIQYYVEAGFEKLMDKYGVDFVMAGHDHVYARSYPMLGGIPDKTGASGESNGGPIKGGDGANAAINPKGTVYFTTTTGSGLKYYELFNNAGNLYVKDNIYYPYLVNGLIGSVEYMNGNLPLSAAKYLQNKTPGFILVNVDGAEVSFSYYDLSGDYLDTPYDTYTVTKVEETATHTVTFASNGGSAVGQLEVYAGDRVSKPVAPTREGYEFLGWYKDAALTDAWDFYADKVLDDLTLYAAWEEVQKPVNEIKITGVTNGNGQADVNFAIRSANGKGYAVYISETGLAGSFKAYGNVSYSAKGAQIKGLTNNKTYYVYIEYSSGTIAEKSGIVELSPKNPGSSQNQNGNSQGKGNGNGNSQ